MLKLFSSKNCSKKINNYSNKRIQNSTHINFDYILTTDMKQSTVEIYDL